MIVAQMQAGTATHIQLRQLSALASAVESLDGRSPSTIAVLSSAASTGARRIETMFLRPHENVL